MISQEASRLHFSPHTDFLNIYTREVKLNSTKNPRRERISICYFAKIHVDGVIHQVCMHFAYSLYMGCCCSEVSISQPLRDSGGDQTCKKILNVTYFVTQYFRSLSHLNAKINLFDLLSVCLGFSWVETETSLLTGPGKPH